MIAALASSAVEPRQQVVRRAPRLPGPASARHSAGRPRDDRLHLGERRSPWPRRCRRDEHLGLPRHELERHLAAQAERRLEFPQAALAAASARGRSRIASVASRSGYSVHRAEHRHVAPVEILAHPLAQLTLHADSSLGQLGGEVEEPMVDGPDLDPQAPAGDRSLRRSEPRHAVRQARPPVRGKAAKDQLRKMTRVGSPRRTTVRVMTGASDLQSFPTDAALPSSRTPSGRRRSWPSAVTGKPGHVARQLPKQVGPRQSTPRSDWIPSSMRVSRYICDGSTTAVTRPVPAQHAAAPPFERRATP